MNEVKIAKEYIDKFKEKWGNQPKFDIPMWNTHFMNSTQSMSKEEVKVIRKVWSTKVKNQLFSPTRLGGKCLYTVPENL